MADLRDAKNEAVHLYLGKSNERIPVVGVGVGVRISDREPSIRLYISEPAIPDGYIVKSRIAGVRTDVVPIGRVQLASGASDCTLVEPQPGSQIEVVRRPQTMPGAFGAVVDVDGRRHILTNNHVLADNDPNSRGRIVLQPRGSHGPARLIATAARFAPISGASTDVDAAVAELEVPANPAVLPPVGQLTGVDRATEGLVVEKIGPATGYRVGTVFDVSADFDVTYSFGKVTLRDQILIRSPRGPFSFTGDSGSLLVAQESKRAVGLLCAYSFSRAQGFFGIANHLQTVLTALGATLVI